MGGSFVAVRFRSAIRSRWFKGVKKIGPPAGGHRTGREGGQWSLIGFTPTATGKSTPEWSSWSNWLGYVWQATRATIFAIAP